MATSERKPAAHHSRNRTFTIFRTKPNTDSKVNQPSNKPDPASPRAAFNPNKSNESLRWFAEQQQRINSDDPRGNADINKTRQQLIDEVCALPVGEPIHWTVFVSDVLNEPRLVAISPLMPSTFSSTSDLSGTVIKLERERMPNESPLVDLKSHPWGATDSSFRELQRGSRVRITGTVKRVEWDGLLWTIKLNNPTVWP
jgi:hypothetical protein